MSRPDSALRWLSSLARYLQIFIDFVTKNGYGRLVVMDIDYYERIMRQMVEAKEIIDAIEDIKDGRTIDGSQAISDIKKKYGI